MSDHSFQTQPYSQILKTLEGPDARAAMASMTQAQLDALRERVRKSTAVPRFILQHEWVLAAIAASLFVVLLPTVAFGYQAPWVSMLQVACIAFPATWICTLILIVTVGGSAHEVRAKLSPLNEVPQGCATAMSLSILTAVGSAYRESVLASGREFTVADLRVLSYLSVQQRVESVTMGLDIDGIACRVLHGLQEQRPLSGPTLKMFI